MVAWRRPPQAHWITGDALLLEQVLTNLLRNAIEAMQGHEIAMPCIEIELSGDESGRRCLLTITDNGPGWTPGHAAVAFHPFRSAKPGGAGIGLMVCATIVQAHDGTIAASNAPQGGARITIDLPLEPER